MIPIAGLPKAEAIANRRHFCSNAAFIVKKCGRHGRAKAPKRTQSK
jgi:hypothetical protein